MNSLVPLGSTARFVNGAAFKPSDWGDNGLPIIRIQNLTGTGEKFNLTTRQVKPELVVEPGDLLVSWSATLDVYRWGGPQGLLNQHIFKVLPNEGVDADYLYYALKSVIRELKSKTHGSTMKHVVRGDFENTLIPLPKLSAQHHIVDLLSRAEGIVRLRREAQAKAQAIIPALFLDMFGDPATNPKGWPIKELGEVLAEPPTLGTMAKPSPTPGAWLDLRVANIQGGQLTLDDKRWLELEKGQVQRFALRDGDLLLARAIGSLDHLGKVVIVHPTSPWTFDSHLMRLRVKRDFLMPEYVKAFLESKGGREEFLKHTRRSAVQFNINGKEIRRIALPLPPIEVQNKFVQQYRFMGGISIRQMEAIGKAEATYQSLLARAFGGGSRAS